MLRKEKGLSQKQVAKDLGLSQALLSHYEKGIRECGLSFVIKSADYFGVSCDFLLGRTEERRSSDRSQERSGEPVNTSERKSITGSVNIIFAILRKINNKYLSGKVTEYLSASVYSIFRMLYSAGGNDRDGMFRLDPELYTAACTSHMSFAKAKCLSALNEQTGKAAKTNVKNALPRLSAEIIREDYPQYSAALFEMIKTVENGEL